MSPCIIYDGDILRAYRAAIFAIAGLFWLAKSGEHLHAILIKKSTGQVPHPSSVDMLMVMP